MLETTAALGYGRDMDYPPYIKSTLRDARTLAAAGRYEEALAKHLWFHEHALELQPALAGVRLSFALSDWLALGELYPPAHEALVRIRDEKAAAIREGKGSWTLFQDVAAINRCLGEPEGTVELFRVLHERQTDLARQCYSLARELLVARGEYPLCLEYLPDAAAEFEKIRSMRQMHLEIADENPILGRPEAGLREFADRAFVKETQQLLAILEGAGRREDARRIRERAREISKRIDEVRY